MESLGYTVSGDRVYVAKRKDVDKLDKFIGPKT
jgi:hypothetical protein